MRTAFEIIHPSIEAENCTLLCEVSNEGFSYAIKDEEQNSFLCMAIYYFDKTTPPVGFPIALQILFHGHPRLSEKFKKIIISYSFPESALIPFSLYDSSQNANVLNLIHGDLHQNDAILTDVISKQSVYNSFRVPTAIYDLMQAQFSNALSIHQNTILLSQNAPEKNELVVIFYAQKIVVSLIKDGKYQLVNTFNYQTAEDISYNLLNICERFDVKNIDLRISGLIEQNSALYKEIYKYFNSIEFVCLPESKNCSEEISQYPSHFFSHIYAIDSCG
ncbi:MAG: DUF3822 family protein [Bacteroidota bacterium]|nr:DUF3822 family protein [Bacteroidota bacterium]